MNNPTAIEAAFKGHGIQLFCECELEKRGSSQGKRVLQASGPCRYRVSEHAAWLGWGRQRQGRHEEMDAIGSRAKLFLTLTRKVVICASSLGMTTNAIMGCTALSSLASHVGVALLQEKSSLFSRDDLWVLSHTLDFGSGSMIARSAFYGPSSTGAVGLLVNVTRLN